jgi:hypothetical protein
MIYDRSKLKSVNFKYFGPLIKDQYTHVHQLGTCTTYFDGEKIIAEWETGILSDGRVLSNNQSWKVHPDIFRPIYYKDTRRMSETARHIINQILRGNKNYDSNGLLSEHRDLLQDCIDKGLNYLEGCSFTYSVYYDIRRA